MVANPNMARTAKRRTWTILDSTKIGQIREKYRMNKSVKNRDALCKKYGLSLSRFYRIVNCEVYKWHTNTTTDSKGYETKNPNAPFVASYWKDIQADRKIGLSNTWEYGVASSKHLQTTMVKFCQHQSYGRSARISTECQLSNFTNLSLTKRTDTRVVRRDIAASAAIY